MMLARAIAFCAGCGEPFTPARSSQTRCRRRCSWKPRTPGDHHAAERRRSAAHDLEFVGIDGEGINRVLAKRTDHLYVCLTVGDRALHHRGQRLRTPAIFDFLYGCFIEQPGACFVGFYLGYDFAQWLRDLPPDRAEKLLGRDGVARRARTAAAHLPPFPVTWDRWNFDILPMRRLKLRLGGTPPDDAPRAATYLEPPREPGMTLEEALSIPRSRWRRRWRWMTICDVGPFFQSSFLKAIDPRTAIEPVCSAGEFATIKAGKERRATATFSKSMLAYNALECDVLARLMRQQNRGLVAEGIKLKRPEWIGPGQAAQAWLRNIKAPTGDQVRERVPDGFRAAAGAAYFGGWFEIFHHGPIAGRSYSYDINSAYPFVMAQLPCLLHGTYTRSFPAGALSLVKAQVRGSHPLVGAMLHRRPDARVLRPRQTSGWFWLHELQAAKRAGFVDSWRLLADPWSYLPCEHAPPLAAIADLYEGRLKVGKNTPAGRAKRLIYNSAYGKHAQSIGDPKFANPVYASLITAGCRIMILDAIASHPRGAADLLMVATDGVTFASPHPALDEHATRLGAWSSSAHDNLSLFMPGVYWDDATRANLSEPKIKSRGISALDLVNRIDRIDLAWQTYRRHGWPRFMIPIRFQLVSPKQAIERGDWSQCGAITRGSRVVSADPSSKRIGDGPGRSRPYDRVSVLASTPYDGRFGEELRHFRDIEFGDHPDGRIVDLLPEVLGLR